MGTADQWHNGCRGPVEQWVQRTSGTVGTEDQRNSEYRGTMGTEDQRNNGYRGPVEQWEQRTRGTKDQRNRGLEEQRTRGIVGTEDQWNS